ncbi:endothelin-converting enzyme [Tothia fuscella]|uniref:Endothelin-converting enzyme n=1 Tax=Tothia fuscella TaxID=1048955 RepID=A0A9P4TTB0_9PEZI|nr:endothelin-converting enzyme [Tothia fuscella]
MEPKQSLVKREEAAPVALAEEVCDSPVCKDWASSMKKNLATNYKTLDPCDDFSTYVCGGWRDTHDFRSDQASVSTGSIMSDENRNVIRSIVEGPYPDANTSFTGDNKVIDKENFQKMKTVFQTCMDTAAIDSYGVAPVQRILDEFEQHYPLTAPKTPNPDELTRAVIWLAKNSVSALVSFGPTTDDKNPDTHILAFGGGERGIGSREYYNNPVVVANYTRAVAQMFQIIQTGKPIEKAKLFEKPDQRYMDTVAKIIEFEKKLAYFSPEPDAAQKIEYFYSPSTVEEMQKVVRPINLSEALKAFVPADYKVGMVLNTDRWYFTNISNIIESTPREVLHAHFQSRLISSWAGRLGKEYRRPSSVYSNMLAGRDPFAESERWRSCLGEVDNSLGWILSASYVEKAFSPAAKKLGDRIVSDIKAVFTERLRTFSWMSDTVKAVAAKKVINIVQKIGYPTASPNILDPKDLKLYYANLTVTSNYFDNGRALERYGAQKGWSELPKPVDRARWGMTAPTVNAYYSPSGNEIVFPAGIMQLPVFGEGLPEYVSYGAFGAVAGHELTHGFDNNGAKYDENGKYADWWDNSTVTNFDRKAECFVNQYANYTVTGLDGKPLHVNGRLTLGENIADAGGLTAAYSAWKKRDAAAPNPKLPGLEEFSKEQLFFMSYSNWWCGKVRPAQAVAYIYSDSHSPADKRILGTTANSAAFREAFKCKVKEPTCELW